MLSWLWHVFTTPFRWFIASVNNESVLNACYGTFTPFWCHLYRPSKHIIFLLFMLRCQLVIISCTAFLWFISFQLWCRLVIIFSTAFHWVIACRLRCSLVIFFSASLLWFIAFQLWYRLVIIFFTAFLWCIAFQLWCRFVMIFLLLFSDLVLFCSDVGLSWSFTLPFCDVLFFTSDVGLSWSFPLLFSDIFLFSSDEGLGLIFSVVITCTGLPTFLCRSSAWSFFRDFLFVCGIYCHSYFLQWIVSCSSVSSYLQKGLFVFTANLKENKNRIISFFCLYQLVLNIEIKYTRNIKLLKILTPLQDRDRNRSV